jgi:predicted phosphodiesterase
MKVCVISDTHYGFKKGSKIFQDYFEAFYSEVFFPKLEELNIDTIIHIGDVFDNRKIIDYNALNWSKRVVFEPLRKYKVHMVIGNHDVYYKNTNKLNSPELLLDSYDNIQIYNNATDISIDGLSISLIPWITADNQDEVFEFIKNTSSDVCFGHLELSGFKVTKELSMEEGMSKSIFNKYKRVFSGHYHTRSTDGHVYYIGNPYEMFSNDADDARGFVIFDTDDMSHEYIDNPYQLFCDLYYDEDVIDMDCPEFF